MAENHEPGVGGPPIRDPRNAPGPFYVEREMCLLCGVPPHEAPDLILLDNDGCYFQKQPETEEELARAIEAMSLACCGAYRYGGDDPDVIRRLLATRVDRCQIDRLDPAPPEPSAGPNPRRNRPWWRWPW